MRVLEWQLRVRRKLREITLKTKIEAIQEKQKFISEFCFEKNMKVHLKETVELREK